MVAVVGDGALTGGMAYEALNNLGHHQLPAIIVLNDNGRSYAETVSRLSERLADLRTDPRFRKARAGSTGCSPGVPLVERLTDAAARGGQDGRLRGAGAAVVRRGARCALPRPLRRSRRRPARARAGHRGSTRHPVLVHVLTQKGKGYAPAETDPEKKLHDTSAFDIATGRSTGSKPRSWTQAFSEAVLDLAAERRDLVAITAAMPGSTGLLPLAERRPDQVLDVGIAEQHAVTAAAGMAHAGKLPLIAVYSTFFARAFDQANLDVGLHDEHVLFVFDRAGITGDDGPSHHGILDMALALRIPTRRSWRRPARRTWQACSARGRPRRARATALPEGRRRARHDLRGRPVPCPGPVVAEAPRRRRRVRAGRRRPRRPRHGGRRLLAEPASRRRCGTCAASGPPTRRCWRAAAPAPLVVTVENGVVGGGAGAELADRLVERAGVRHAPPVLKLGVPDSYLPHGKPDRILAELGLDAAGIAAATRKVLSDDG